MTVEPTEPKPTLRRLRFFSKKAKAVVIRVAAARRIRREAAAMGNPSYTPVRLPPNSPGVEAMYQPTFGSGAKIVAVVGVEAGAGATTCARALAERSALTHCRTLLVDASTCHGFLAAADTGEKGEFELFTFQSCAHSPNRTCGPDSQCTALVDATTGACLPATSLVVRTEKYAQLTLQACEDDPYRFRSIEKLRQNWSDLLSSFEAIVIDCGPAIELLPSTVPASLAARSSDAVILVGLGGKETRESISAAMTALRTANVVGVIINGRDQATVGAELAREFCMLHRFFPKLATALADRVKNSKALNVPV